MASIEVTDRWTGPGRSDRAILTPPASVDGWHPSAQRGQFEHWYFDARLDDGHVVVGFLQTAELITKRPGVELHVYKPDGTRIEIRKRYPLAAVSASTDDCQVRVGANRVRTDYPPDGLPVFHLQLDEDGVRFDLRFHAELPAWQPGLGRTDYGPRDYFAWLVGAPRARVSGTIAYEGCELTVTGIGYHDHNWGVGNMAKIVDHWYWGRVYAEDFTLVYADVTAREKYGSHASTPVMLARDGQIVLSTGEVRSDFTLSVELDGGREVRHGSTLHEMVALR